MNPTRRIPRNIFAGFDFGSDVALAAIAVKSKNGGLEILGAGEAPSRGIRDGVMTHIGDVVETVVEALDKAERSSGCRVQTLYYNLDDPLTESVFSRGSRTLKGEGEIRFSDAEEARKSSERLIRHFEKTILYSRSLHFVIDDRDTVFNPVGVFGQKLDILTHVLMVKSSTCDVWERVMRRAQVRRSEAVLSMWSSVYGVLEPAERVGRKLICDAGDDFLNICAFENNMITGYRILLSSQTALAEMGRSVVSAAKEFAGKEGAFAELVLTGDRASDEKTFEAIKTACEFPVRVAAPKGISGLGEPRYAALAGLLRVAEELESRAPCAILNREKSLVGNAKEKFLSLLNEYF